MTLDQWYGLQHVYNGSWSQTPGILTISCSLPQPLARWHRSRGQWWWPCEVAPWPWPGTGQHWSASSPRVSTALTRLSSWGSLTLLRMVVRLFLSFWGHSVTLCQQCCHDIIDNASLLVSMNVVGPKITFVMTTSHHNDMLKIIEMETASAACCYLRSCVDMYWMLWT